MLIGRKHTTPLPNIRLSESDSILYTNFKFCEGKNHRLLRNTLMYKAKIFKLMLNISRNVNKFWKTTQIVCK